jgi:hypothetical protein
MGLCRQTGKPTRHPGTHPSDRGRQKSVLTHYRRMPRVCPERVGPGAMQVTKSPACP